MIVMKFGDKILFDLLYDSFFRGHFIVMAKLTVVHTFFSLLRFFHNNFI